MKLDCVNKLNNISRHTSRFLKYFDTFLSKEKFQGRERKISSYKPAFKQTTESVAPSFRPQVHGDEGTLHKKNKVFRKLRIWSFTEEILNGKFYFCAVGATNNYGSTGIIVV